MVSGGSAIAGTAVGTEVGGVGRPSAITIGELTSSGRGVAVAAFCDTIGVTVEATTGVGGSGMIGGAGDMVATDVEVAETVAVGVFVCPAAKGEAPRSVFSWARAPQADIRIPTSKPGSNLLAAGKTVLEK